MQPFKNNDLATARLAGPYQDNSESSAQATLASQGSTAAKRDRYAESLDPQSVQAKAVKVEDSKPQHILVRSTAPPPGAIRPSAAVVALLPPTPLRDEPGVEVDPGAAPSTSDPGGQQPVLANAGTTPAPVSSEEQPAIVEPSEVSITEPGPGAQPPLELMKALVSQSREAVQGMPNYQFLMDRQERVDSQLLPAERILVSIRREPFAVRLEWPEGPSKGREVIFSEGGPMHIQMPNALIPRLTMAPDSPLARKNSRHPISEAGFSPVLEQLAKTIELHESGQGGAEQLRYEGTASAPVSGSPNCHKLIRVTEEGETWVVLLDTQTKLPTFVEATARDGSLMERISFAEVKTNLPELASNEAFDPDARWGPAQSLFSRLARTLEPNAAGAPSTTR